jgi:hypothetical protein
VAEIFTASPLSFQNIDGDAVANPGGGDLDKTKAEVILARPQSTSE